MQRKKRESVYVTNRQRKSEKVTEVEKEDRDIMRELKRDWKTCREKTRRNVNEYLL